MTHNASDPASRATRTVTVVRDHVLSIPAVILRISPGNSSNPSYDVPLGLRPIVIGRDPSCDIRLDDPGISQRHCEISLTTRGIEVEDVGSKNGIFVHSVRIVHAIVPPDVPVQLGHSQILVRQTGSISEIPLSPKRRLGPAMGHSAVMRALFHQMDLAANSDKHLVFWGERGSGKRTLARAFHTLGSGRTGEFVELDVRAESAATCEAAFYEALQRSSRGTLYVHEPADLQPELQSQLARTIARRTDGSRLVLGMREDPASMAKRGVLVADFFVPNLPFVNLPVFPLRHHRDDIGPLVEFFLRRHGERFVKDLAPGTMELLEKHSWPGNVGQLEDVVEDIAQRMNVGDKLLKSLVKATNTKNGEEIDFAGTSWKEAREEVLEAFENSFIASILRKHNRNVTHAANEMGISRQLLHRLMKKHGIKS